MKTTTILFAAVLTLQMNILFAGNDNTITPVSNENTSITMISISPSTPVEATFEEVVEINEIANFAPIMPSEASFEDMPSEMISIVDLAPATPSTADFEETIDLIPSDIMALIPVTPVEAVFE